MTSGLRRRGKRSGGGKEEKYNVTLSGPSARCERIKGTFEEPEDDSESAGRVVSMITRNGETFESGLMKAHPGPLLKTPATLTVMTQKEEKRKRATNDGGVQILQKQHTFQFILITIQNH